MLDKENPHTQSSSPKSPLAPLSFEGPFHTEHPSDGLFKPAVVFSRQHFFKLPPTLIEYEGQKFFFLKKYFMVGRDRESCQLWINDPKLEGEHLQIDTLGDVLFITDRGGKAGSYLNHQKLMPQQKYFVEQGDRITIGSTSFTLFTHLHPLFLEKVKWDLEHLRKGPTDLTGMDILDQDMVEHAPPPLPVEAASEASVEERAEQFEREVEAQPPLRDETLEEDEVPLPRETKIEPRPEPIAGPTPEPEPELSHHASSQRPTPEEPFKMNIAEEQSEVEAANMSAASYVDLPKPSALEELMVQATEEESEKGLNTEEEQNIRAFKEEFQKEDREEGDADTEQTKVEVEAHPSGQTETAQTAEAVAAPAPRALPTNQWGVLTESANYVLEILLALNLGILLRGKGFEWTAGPLAYFALRTAFVGVWGQSPTHFLFGCHVCPTQGFGRTLHARVIDHGKLFCRSFLDLLWPFELPFVVLKKILPFFHDKRLLKDQVLDLKTSYRGHGFKIFMQVMASVVLAVVLTLTLYKQDFLKLPTVQFAPYSLDLLDLESASTAGAGLRGGTGRLAEPTPLYRSTGFELGLFKGQNPTQSPYVLMPMYKIVQKKGLSHIIPKLRFYDLRNNDVLTLEIHKKIPVASLLSQIRKNDYLLDEYSPALAEEWPILFSPDFWPDKNGAPQKDYLALWINALKLEGKTSLAFLHRQGPFYFPYLNLKREILKSFRMQDQKMVDAYLSSQQGANAPLLALSAKKISPFKSEETRELFFFPFETFGTDPIESRRPNFYGKPSSYKITFANPFHKSESVKRFMKYFTSHFKNHQGFAGARELSSAATNPWLASAHAGMKDTLNGKSLKLSSPEALRWMFTVSDQLLKDELEDSTVALYHRYLYSQLKAFQNYLAQNERGPNYLTKSFSENLDRLIDGESLLLKQDPRHKVLHEKLVELRAKAETRLGASGEGTASDGAAGATL